MKRRQVFRLLAGQTILATGGLGQVYRETTNPGVATGDGAAMAYRAGAEVGDMEFVQFHPTALYVEGAPRFLLSEALRGEGAYLRNMQRERFMPKYHPLAELAPRDVVARAIVREFESTRRPDAVVYLDLSHLDSKHVQSRFPRIFQTCLQYGIDITSDLVPVRPAAHYAMGGVRTDLNGRTNLKGLFAAGEAACTGVHGANRLASNSLLEGLVYGARAANAMQNEIRPNRRPATVSSHPLPEPASQTTSAVVAQIRDLMWRNVGIVRSGTGLKEAIAELENLRNRLPQPCTRGSCEATNIHQVALLIAKSALERLESRGAHYRTDYPDRDDVHFKKHSVLRRERIRFE